MQRCHFLVFDPSWDGHHTEFLRHIAKRSEELSVKTIIVCHPKSGAAKECLLAGGKNVAFDFLSEEECAPLATRRDGMLNQGHAQWQILQNRIHLYRPRHCVIMHLNPLQWELLWNFDELRAVKYSGILFNPVGLTLSELRASNIVRTFRKVVTTYLVASCGRCEPVYLLNDKETATRWNKFVSPRTQIFREIPDPVWGVSQAPKLFDRADRGKGRPMRFLLFGSIDRRKGILILLESLKYIKPEIQANIQIRIAGKCNDIELIKIVNYEIASNLRAGFRGALSIENRYYTVEQMAAEINLADALLLPYLDSNSSSGILGHAAFHKKPVIASRCGILGSLVARYSLGMLVPAGSAADLASAIENYVRLPVKYNERNAEQYCVERSPERFADGILSLWRGGDAEWRNLI